MGLGLVTLTGWPGFGLDLRGFRPDWPLTLTLWLALRAEFNLALGGAFIFGLGQGYLTLAPPGLFSLKLMVGVLIVRLVVRKLEISGTFLTLLALTLSGLLSLGLEPWLLELTASQPFLARPTAHLVARTALLTALTIIPIFAFWDRLFRPPLKQN
jgi:hypothetical protein